MANSQIEWQTGTPNETGKYIITDKYGNVDVDEWLSFSKEWYSHYHVDVMAFCNLRNIKSYEQNYNIKNNI